MEYKGYEIHLKEAHVISSGTPNGTEYTVKSQYGLVYQASSELGDSYALSPQEALKGAQELIDRYSK